MSLTGTISGSGYSVSVNGVAADVNGISWSAADVPVTPGGVACFTAAAAAGRPDAGQRQVRASQARHDRDHHLAQ